MQEKAPLFWQAGDLATLLSAFFYFLVGFMIWVLVGALGPAIAAEFGLTASQKGLIVAAPILGGSLLRIPTGFLSDRIGAKNSGIITLLLFIPPLAGLCWFSESLNSVLFWGLLIGIGGGTFAVALPLVRPWYPARFQGLALGIVGAGNCGTVFASLLAPRLAAIAGWRMVFGLALIPVALIILIFHLFAKEYPSKKPKPVRSGILAMLRESEVYAYCFLYAVTFGGFVGLASYLSIFFADQYGLSQVMAGDCAAFAALAGSLIRPVGGYLADRFGGRTVLGFIFAGTGALAGAISTSLPLGTALACFFLIMAALGAGNGAVFQLVSLRFSKIMGAMTGIIGAVGGLGGFFLPTLLGAFRQMAGSYSAGFLTFAAANAAALLIIAGAVTIPEESDAGG